MYLIINTNYLRIMPIISTKESTVASSIVLSLEEYREIVDEASSTNETYSKIGHLYPENNTPQYRWFKGSRDRGIKEDFAA